MPFARANETEIYFEDSGPEGAPVLLIVTGFTSQLISWDEALIDLFRAEGFRVVRFDNRDVGLTSKTAGPPPSFTATADGRLQVEDPPYTLADMASDAVAVLDALGVDRAHVIGNSMGGMISQHIAFGHPDRVSSMTSVMSTTGNPDVGRPTPEAASAMLTPPPSDRQGFIEHAVWQWSHYSGPHFDPDRIRERAGRSYDRSYNPAGGPFQLGAVLSDGDRTERLAGVACPVLVLHGTHDALIAPTGGEATAAAIPGAELVLLDEMGHDMLPRYHDEVVAAVVKNAARA